MVPIRSVFLAAVALGGLVSDVLPAQVPVSGKRQFFAAPDGSASADGSKNHPWDLATALSGRVAVRPGDTVWLRGGTYRGGFTSNLTGQPDAPIMVRQYPGERATIDAAGFPHFGLAIDGAWAWFYDLEITSSDSARTNPTPGSNPRDLRRAGGVNINGPYAKLINAVVHDTLQGVGCWTPASGAEVYGCLIYYNGWDAPDRGHGHGIYTQNRDATKRIADNIIFGQFSHGIHAYTENGYLDDFVVEGNICFNNGVLSKVSGPAGNILLGGSKIAHNPQVIANYTYFPGPAGNNNVGYIAGTDRLVCRRNYFAGGTALTLAKPSGAVLAQNVFYGAIKGFTAQDYPDNTYSAQPPERNKIVVRRNRYASNRYHIAIYNWALKDAVEVDFSTTAMHPGDKYEIRNAQDYFGGAITATYSGKPLLFDMRDQKVAVPTGWQAPHSTFPEFGVFILTVVP